MATKHVLCCVIYYAAACRSAIRSSVALSPDVTHLTITFALNRNESSLLVKRCIHITAHIITITANALVLSCSILIRTSSR